MISWIASARRTDSSPGVVTALSRRWCAGKSVVIRGRQAVPLFDAGEDGFLEDVEHAESGVLENSRNGPARTPSPRAFAWLGIKAASSSVWRYSANAGVIVVEAKLVDGLACPFFIQNPDEISRPGECVKRCESGGKR
jgi:hypothetical protein